MLQITCEAGYYDQNPNAGGSTGDNSGHSGSNSGNNGGNNGSNNGGNNGGGSSTDPSYGSTAKPPTPSTTPTPCIGIPGATDDNPPSRYRRGTGNVKKAQKQFTSMFRKAKTPRKDKKKKGSKGASGGNKGASAYTDGSSGGSTGGYTGGNENTEKYMWGNWGNWGKCCASCDHGEQARKRICFEWAGYGYFPTSDTACEINVGEEGLEKKECYRNGSAKKLMSFYANLLI